MEFFSSGVHIVLCSYLFCEHLRRILVTSIDGFARIRVSRTSLDDETSSESSCTFVNARVRHVNEFLAREHAHVFCISTIKSSDAKATMTVAMHV